MSNAVSEVRRRMAAVTDVDPDTVLITFYVSNELPPEERQRVEERMRVDPVFRRALEAAQAIRALPAWVGLTEEDEQWLRFARRRRPNVARVTPPSSVRPIASARSALWARAPWAAGIAGIAFLSGVGVETARIALGAHDTDQRQVATSAPVHDTVRVLATSQVPNAQTKGSASTAPGASPVRPRTKTPDSAALARLLDGRSLGPVVVATTKPETPQWPAVVMKNLCDSIAVARALEQLRPAPDTTPRPGDVTRAFFGAFIDGLFSRHGRDAVNRAGPGSSPPMVPRIERGTSDGAASPAAAAGSVPACGGATAPVKRP